MGFAVIEKHYEMTRYLTQQMAEEYHHFFALDVVLI